MMLLKRSGLVVPLVALVIMCGCQQPLKWSIQPMVKPDPIKAGADFSVICKVDGELEKVGWVNAVPLAAPEAVMEMKDEGTEGDAKKGDGVFTHTRLLPGSVDPGMYELEFVVYDKNGDPIEVPSFTVLDKDGKKVLKEVTPEEQGGKKPAAVELAWIITVEVK